MPSNRQQIFDSKDWLRTRELAPSCGWLSATLDHQQRLLECIDVLARAGAASDWFKQWCVLEKMLDRHLRLEETVLSPAIFAMGQRAHAVLAHVRRSQIRHGLEDLRCPSWEDGSTRLEQLRLNLVSHFSQEQSWSYRALARDQDQSSQLYLTARCRAIIGEAGLGDPDAAAVDAPIARHAAGSRS